MLSLSKPTYDELSQFLERHRDVPFTYREVEATRRGTPDGYTCGHQRVCLGSGREVFLKARQNLLDWRMFPSEFVDIVWPCPLEVGRVVATLFRAPGFWTLNPCRIVYTLDEVLDNVERFGFAYGTIGNHLAAGEERFTVEHNHDDDTVWYEIYCFSRADHWLAKLAYPYLRIQQHRFRSLSARAMRQAAQRTRDSSQPFARVRAPSETSV